MKLEKLFEAVRVMYHGTEHDIHSFSEIRPPFFLAKHANDVKFYATRANGSGFIHKVNCTYSKLYEDDMETLAEEVGLKYKTKPYFVCKEIDKYGGDSTNVSDIIYIPSVQKYLRDHGYDGVGCWDILMNDEIYVYIIINTSTLRIMETIEHSPDPEDDDASYEHIEDF